MNFHKTTRKTALKTHADAVLHFFKLMDIEMINDLLDNNRTYQEFPKDKFILKLDFAFEQFKTAGDTTLLLFAGSCGSQDCSNYKCTGFSFAGNQSGCFMNLIFDIQNGIVCDIYECHFFKKEAGNGVRGKKIFIDNCW